MCIYASIDIHYKIVIYFFTGEWEIIDQNLSSDDEQSPSNESLGPDHLTRDE